VLKGKQSIRGSVLGKQNSESELLLEDDDTLSSLEEKELENLTGKEQPPSDAQTRTRLSSAQHRACYRSSLCTGRALSASSVDNGSVLVCSVAL